MTIFVLLVLLTCSTVLLYVGRSYWAWVAPLGLLFAWWWTHSAPGTLIFSLALAPCALLAAIFGIRPLRRAVLTGRVLKLMKPMFPNMSDTERVALEAGTVWWDAELFAGRPDWKKLIDFKPPGLSKREQAFLDDEVEELCRLVDNEQVEETGDLSPEAWQFLKDKGFMGIIIPQKFGGLEFSAEANSAIVTKVASHNTTLAVTVMVPNSLGPAELLLHYGTDEQKQHYLPLLADGTEVPAFALTEAGAGSDAGAMSSLGVVCKGEWKGSQTLGIRLNWDKRYITLAPVATLLGLAFKLHDPDHLIGDVEHLGITCALVPTVLPGVEIGQRHDPLGIKFLNGPTRGKDVFIPLEQIIGGTPMAGQGWRMLMDCLSAGRSISLPSLAVGGAKVACRVVSAYALVREQFGMPIARFEGIEEPLARIFGLTWAMDAARGLTAGVVASGEKPSVLGAIVKAWLTEGMRDVVNDAMDIQGGAGISKGPRNTLAALYQGAPIGITVEGANILTRTLIVFGQGALRCHPYAFAEMEAARSDDLQAFDRLFFKHVGLVASSITRSFLLSLTGGKIARSPVSGPAARHYQRINQLSASFAVASEMAMASLGGALKRKEKITGRLADALAWLYIGSSCLKRFELEGSRSVDEALLHWTCEMAAHRAQEALHGVMRNLPNRYAANVLRMVAFPLGRHVHAPSDRLGARIVRGVLEDPDLRDRLTTGIYLPPRDRPGLGALDRGYDLLRAAADPRAKLKVAIRDGRLPRAKEAELLDQALRDGVLNQEEADAVRTLLEAREDLIQVDSYDPATYLARCKA